MDVSEPGIPGGNKDSRRNENQKSLRNIFSVGKKIYKYKHTFFSMKLRWWICECKLRVQNWIFIMNFSVLDFFKFTSRMPQIAHILVSTFKIVWGGIPLDPLEISSFFFVISNSRLWCIVCRLLLYLLNCQESFMLFWIEKTFWSLLW